MLRDPTHIRNIVEQQDPKAINTHRYEQIFGSPKTTLRIYANKEVGPEERKAVAYAHFTLPDKYLTGTSLASIIDVYVSILSRSLHDKMFQVGFWTQIEDFWSFFQQVMTRCTMETLFGSAMYKDYPGLTKDYWKFNDDVESFMPGMPRPLTPAAYEKSRDRLHRGIERWLRKNHSGSEFAKISEEDPVWDEHKGSKFIQERDDVLAKTEGLDVKARVAEILSIMHGYVRLLASDSPVNSLL